MECKKLYTMQINNCKGKKKGCVLIDIPVHDIVKPIKLQKDVYRR